MRNRFPGLLRALTASGLLLLAGCEARVDTYDIVVRGGTVVDGTGAAPFVADVGIRDGRIVAVGEIGGEGRREIDARGRHVSPGWIDIMDQSGPVLPESGLAENKLLMGVTSAIGGEGGFPVAAGDIPAYFASLEQRGISLNFGSYYSIGQAREAVVGRRDVEVSDAQLEDMKTLMRTAMEAGAVGMSSAAFYPPESFIRTRELVEVGKVVAGYDGIYAAHMRDESARLLEAIGEMITVAREARLDTHIFHLKNAFAPNWGEGARAAVDMIAGAREAGLEISADVYPYVAGGTGIDATVPTEVFARGREQAVATLRDPENRAELKRAIASPDSDRMLNNAGGWHNIVLVNPHNPDYEALAGMNFEEIGEALGKDPADAAWDIMLEAMPERAMALYFLMSEEDLQLFLQQSWVSIGSDAGASLVLGEVDATGLPHPRSYGTFPRIIARYVREEQLLSLPEAIRKMTSLPAQTMKLQGRGVIGEGMWADIVVFDYEAIEDRATWESPMRVPTGIDRVIVNGVVVVEAGRHTGATPGRVLYGPGYQLDRSRGADHN